MIGRTALAVEGEPPEGWRIAYLARATEGGSARSLLTLVRGLDRSLYAPCVLFHCIRDACLAAEVEALGVPVVGLVRPWQAPPALPALNVTGRLGGGGWRGPVLAGYRLARAVLDAARLDLRWQPALVRELRRRRPALVHCNNGLRSHRLDILTCAALGLPVVCHVRNWEPMTALERLAAGCVWRFIYISHAVAADYQRQGIPPAQGVVIHNALSAADLEVPTPLPRAEFGWGPEHFVVANVGRLVRWKGQDVFLQALAELAPRRPDLRALVIGGPDPTDDSRAFAAELAARIDSLGLAGRVLLTGHRRDVPRLMAMSDVVVHSAVAPEPFGRVIIEALAAARPVIATAAGGVVDILEQEKTGLLVPPNDAGALARAVDRLAADAGLRARLAAAGRGQATARFSAGLHVETVTSLYQDCFARQPRRAEAVP